MSLFRHYIIGPILIGAVGLVVMASCGSTSDADRVRAVVHDHNMGWAKADPTVCSRYLTPAARNRLRAENVLADPETCEQLIAKVVTTPEERRAIDRLRIKRVTFADDHTRAIVRDEDVEVSDPLLPDTDDRPVVLLKDRDGHWRIDDLG